MSFESQVIVKIKRLVSNAKFPTYEHFGDSGADIHSVDEYTLEPLQRIAISTGISVEVPFGFEIQVRPKSGLALKHGLTVLNTPGTIDAGYRGEIKVIIINLGSESFLIQKGQKIAQLVVVPVVRASFEETDELSQSQRGIGGFGSTGIS